MFLRLFLIVGILLSNPALATPLPLHRGINLSNWLANAERQPLDARDFQNISKAGFDYVRLPVDPESFGFHLDSKANGLDRANFTPVDKALELARQNHLTVILDIHPSHDFEDKLENNYDAEQAFYNLWIYLAKHYDEKNYLPAQLAFEPLNEPHYYHHEDNYEALMAQIITTLRKISPHRTLIIGAPRGSSIEGLTTMHPLNDNNIIYDFHFYEPYIITHQGIHRGFEKTMIRYFHNLPYPSSAVDHGADVYAPDAPNPAEAVHELNDYVSAEWGRDMIKSRLKLAQDWALSHNVQIICGEFGVLRNHIDAASRYRWIADTRTALDKADIGWALWDYADLMGIVRLKGDVSAPDPVDGSVHLLDLAKGSREFEPEALTALGLSKS